MIKSQTATEYIVLIAIVVVISMVVVSVLGGLGGGSSAKKTASAELLSAKIGISQFAVFNQYVKLRVMNNNQATVSINRILLNEIECYPLTNEILRSGESMTISRSCEHLPWLSPKDKYSYKITIDYTDIVTGASYVQNNSQAYLTGESASPQTVMFRPSIAMDAYHTCAVSIDGKVYCWGSDFAEQLGNGDVYSGMYFAYPAVGIDNAVDVEVGRQNTCALIQDGSVKCWGSDSWGQLGDGSVQLPDYVSTPQVVSQVSNAIKVRVGWFFSCALIQDGTVKCWGLDNSGQLGDGVVGPMADPTPTSVVGLTNVVDILANYNYACALLATGVVKCWGDDSFGQLGDGVIGTPNFNPSPRTVVGVNATKIWNSEPPCALLTNGTIKCWSVEYSFVDSGISEYSGYGILMKNGQYIFEDGVTGIHDAVAADYGESGGSCVVLSDGSAKCFGDNEYGQLGNGGTTDSPLPVLVITDGMSG